MTNIIFINAGEPECWPQSSRWDHLFLIISSIISILHSVRLSSYPILSLQYLGFLAPSGAFYIAMITDGSIKSSGSFWQNTKFKRIPSLVLLSSTNCKKYIFLNPTFKKQKSCSNSFRACDNPTTSHPCSRWQVQPKSIIILIRIIIIIV